MIYLNFLYAPLLTALIECSTIAILFRKRCFVYYVLLMNLLTNPLLNLLLLLLVKLCGAEWYAPALIIMEMLAISVEAYILYYLCAFNIKKSIFVSLLLNLLSYSGGLLFFSS